MLVFGEMDASLLTTLQLYNPWLDAPETQSERLLATLPSDFLDRRRRLELRARRAELVVGPRQAGKSTWIRSSLARLDAPVLILHAEEPRVQELCRSPALALDALRDVLTEPTVLFFEEVQHLPEAPRFLKGLVDLAPGRKIVATGSSSFTLRARVRESLAGRVRRTRLLPFSLEEVAAEIPEGLVPAIRDQRLAALWERLVVQGGYPEPWREPDPEALLHQLVEAFVLKDASDLHTIEHPSAFRKLLELAAADVGNLVNYSEWASLAQVTRPTASRYLDIAEEAHLLRMVQPFVGGKRSEITGAPKVYFLDNGLRNTVFGGFAPLDARPDRGALWENAVFSELMKRLELLDEILFWRSKGGAEVDFIVRRSNRMVAIEVKASALRRPKISRSARSFLDAYSPDLFGIVNAGLRLETEENGVPIHFCRPWELDVLLAGLD